MSDSLIIAGGLLVLVVAAAGWFHSRPRVRNRRGRELLSARAVEAAEKTAEGAVTWGGVPLPRSAETSHFLVMGTTGSGKTLTLSRLMREALRSARPGSDTRALVYDAKTEMASELDALSLDVPIVFANPFDERASAWRMSADVTSPASALQVASIFIPEEEGSSNRYFTDTARDLLREVMLTFIRTGVDWSLRDLVIAMRSRESLEAVLGQTAEGTELLGLHAGDARAFHNVLSTARSRLAPFEPIAALWSKARTQFSLRDFVESEMVLVVGNDDSARAAMDALNRVIFQRFSELALRQPNSTARRTWVFLDEVREAGKLDGLSRLLTKGRSRGVCCALGFQCIHGLRSVYGEEVTLEIVGQCSQKAFLRCESEATAKWASGTIGQYEEIDVLRGESNRGLGAFDSNSRSASEQWRTADLVLPSELLSIPPTTMETGLTGYYLTPHVGAFRRTLPLRDFTGRGRAREGVVDFLERPESDQYLERWGVADCLRLGLAHERIVEQDPDFEIAPSAVHEPPTSESWEEFRHAPAWRRSA